MFQVQPGSEANYLSALEFIYQELIHMHSQRSEFDAQLPFYEKLIRLKLSVYRTCEPLLDLRKINEVFKLEVQKAQCFCRALRFGQIDAKSTFTESSKIIERLDEYPDSFEIDPHLLEEATLSELKIRQALGRTVSYRRLEQLSKSENETTRSTALYITAYELSRRNFDAEAVEFLWNALTNGSTSNNFKSKRLYFLL